MKEKNFIVLYNPISNEGHLDSWHVLFATLLLRSGYGVVAITSDPEGLRNKLNSKGYVPNEILRIVGMQGQESAKPETSEKYRLTEKLRQAWLKWNVYCDEAQYQQHWRLLQIKKQPLAYLGLRFQFSFLKRLAQLTQFLHGLYKKTKQHQSSSVAAASQSLNPEDYLEQVNAELTRQPGQIQAVLNMYIDAYPPTADVWKSFRFKESTPWGALCITPTERPEQGYYQAPDYKGTLLLDEKLAARYREQLTQFIFEYLPDVADTALPTEGGKLARELRVLAGSRKIVFMGGSIGKQKNLSCWIELIALADPKQWFFVQIGRINKNNLTREDEQALRQVLVRPPENLYIQPTYLADERSFNEIISISDVIFAVYRDFGRSSNMLSKAAYFEKPILVANQCLMGDLVEKYSIGYSVAQGDTLAMYQALCNLSKIENLKAHFQTYRNDFSEEIMQQKLVDFLKLSISN
jgi:hypothetical protein